MFVFNALISKAKMLRIVLRHGIRPDFSWDTFALNPKLTFNVQKIYLPICFAHENLKKKYPRNKDSLAKLK